jgi:hypothetical protein
MKLLYRFPENNSCCIRHFETLHGPNVNKTLLL